MINNRRVTSVFLYATKAFATKMLASEVSIKNNVRIECLTSVAHINVVQNKIYLHVFISRYKRLTMKW